jgi:hypothetical protein
MGSPRFRLYLNDMVPVLKKGGWGALLGFLTVAALPALGVTVEHYPLVSLVSGSIGAGIQALIEFVANKTKV